MLKFMVEYCCFSYTATFHTDVVHEHSLFRCISHMWHFNTGSSAADRMFIKVAGAQDYGWVAHDTCSFSGDLLFLTIHIFIMSPSPSSRMSLFHTVSLS
jgi:hypothetical protein